MDFFIFSNSSEKDIGTEYPQSQESILPKGKTVQDSDYIWNVKHGQLPDFKPFFGTLKLHRKAILTDLISAVSVDNGFIVSDKLLKIFLQANPKDFTTEKVKIKKGLKIYNYNLGR